MDTFLLKPVVVAHLSLLGPAAPQVPQVPETQSSAASVGGGALL